MCGIAGFWSKNGALDQGAFDQALNLMEKRGPDESLSIKTSQANIGTQRLKIIGIDSGQQPITDLAGHFLAFNGAIYNYPEIAKSLHIASSSDTEILFQLIRKRGINTSLEALRGMFAFAFYDRNKESFFLARDRIGQKPLYYYHDEDCFLFASTLKTLTRLMKLAGKTIKIRADAIYHYLCFSNIPEPETIYQNVFALAPAHILHFEKGKISIESYWKFNYLPKHILSYEEAKIQCQHHIEEATRIRLRADVPVGLFLSGGWDSSIIAYEVAKSNQKIKAFTVEYPFQTNQNESKTAAVTAKKFGLQHEIIKLEAHPLRLLEQAISVFEQPHADSSALPNLAIAHAASKQVKVMLNGDGGDEQFAGYRRYFPANYEAYFAFLKHLNPILPNTIRRTPIAFLKRTARILSIPYPDRYLAYTVDMFRDMDQPKFWQGEKPTESGKLIGAKMQANLSPLDQLMHLDRNFNLLSGILVKMDRSSMAYSIEARSPFLDHHLFEFSSKLPDHYKISGLNRKRLLKDIYAKFLPKEVSQAPKISFEGPLENWLQHEFHEILNDLLKNPQAKIYQYVQYGEVVQLLSGSKYQNRNTAYMKYSLLVLELWLQQNQ